MVDAELVACDVSLIVASPNLTNPKPTPHLSLSWLWWTQQTLKMALLIQDLLQVCWVLHIHVSTSAADLCSVACAGFVRAAIQNRNVVLDDRVNRSRTSSGKKVDQLPSVLALLLLMSKFCLVSLLELPLCSPDPSFPA